MDEDNGILIGAAAAVGPQQDLTATGFDAWLDKQRLKAGAVWTAEIEREVDTWPVVLALLATNDSRSAAVTPPWAPAARQRA